MKLFYICVLLNIICSISMADNLYPKCAGEELDHRVANSQGATALFTIPGKGTKLIGQCLAFDVSSITAGSCNVPHQTQLPFRLYLQATGMNTDGSPYLVEFDLQDVVGGSLSGLTFSTVVSSTFTVFFVNQHTSNDCLMRVRAIITTAFITETPEQQKYAAPSVVHLDPNTVFAHHDNSTYLVLRMQDTPRDNDALSLVGQGDSCVTPSRARVTLERVTDPSTLNYYLTPYAGTGFHTVWKHYFDTPGSSTVCYTRARTSADAQDIPPENIGYITVFGGNPRYFDIISGASPRGEVFLYSPLVMRFYGTNLDTRPNGDNAKLVVDTEECPTGSPGGGVPLATNLGPADDWGPRTTYTDWDLTITIGGSYKVCYKRATGSWEETPYIADVPSGAMVDQRTTQEPPPPIPTDPVNKKPCPLSPTRTTPARAGTILRLTLKGAVPAYFRDLVAQTLCVEAASVVLYPYRLDTAGNAVIPLDIICPPTYCNSFERKYFILYNFANNPSALSELKLVTVEEINSVGLNIADSSTTPTPKGGPILPLFLVCLTVVAIVGIVAFGIVQYRKSQHHFIQFGIPEEDEEAPEVVVGTTQAPSIHKGVVASNI